MNEETAQSSDMQAVEEPMIQISDMHKWYGDFHVLRGIDLTINKKERIVICGPSGSGKSTREPNACLNSLRKTITKTANNSCTLSRLNSPTRNLKSW